MASVPHNSIIHTNPLTVFSGVQVDGPAVLPFPGDGRLGETPGLTAETDVGPFVHHHVCAALVVQDIGRNYMKRLCRVYIALQHTIILSS